MDFHAQIYLNETQVYSEDPTKLSSTYKNGFYITKGTILQGEQYIYHRKGPQKHSKKKAKTSSSFTNSEKSKNKEITRDKLSVSKISHNKPIDFQLVIHKGNNQRINVGNNEKVCAVTSGSGTLKFILNNNISILFNKICFFKNIKISMSSILIQDCHLTYLSIRPPPGNLT